MSDDTKLLRHGLVLASYLAVDAPANITARHALNLIDTIERLERELDDARRDAVRLLWLAEIFPSEIWERLTAHWPTSGAIAEYRAAIDAAMGESDGR